MKYFMQAYIQHTIRNQGVLGTDVSVPGLGKKKK